MAETRPLQAFVGRGDPPCSSSWKSGASCSSGHLTDVFRDACPPSLVTGGSLQLPSEVHFSRQLTLLPVQLDGSTCDPLSHKSAHVPPQSLPVAAPFPRIKAKPRLWPQGPPGPGLGSQPVRCVPASCFSTCCSSAWSMLPHVFALSQLQVSVPSYLRPSFSQHTLPLPLVFLSEPGSGCSALG